MGIVQLNRSWRTWRAPVTSRDSISGAVDLKPGGGAPSQGTDGTTRNRLIVPSGVAIAIRGFGKSSWDDVAPLEIVGRMDSESGHGDGIGHSLWEGDAKLGEQSFTSTIPLADGRWGDAATWLEIDWDTPGGHNAANAVTIVGSNQAMLLLPTMGYPILEAFFSRVASLGGDMSEVGLLWRDLSAGDVFALVKTL